MPRTADLISICGARSSITKQVRLGGLSWQVLRTGVHQPSRRLIKA